MGNRLRKTVNGVAEGYSYNNANMLLTQGAATYTNDANGNTLTDGAANRTMTWDAQNQMTSCVYNGTTSTFTYGEDGLRRRMVVGSNTTDYLLDGQNVVREIKNGVVNATYLYGPCGPEYKRNASGNCEWYLYDGMGSVVGTVDQSGNVLGTRKYDVYGGVRGSTGNSSTRHKFVGGLGHASDDETGLTYMRARYMDPATGRFVSEDPAKNGANWFEYAGGSPTNCVDASGKTAAIIFIGLVQCGAALLGYMLAYILCTEIFEWASPKYKGGRYLPACLGVVIGGVGNMFSNLKANKGDYDLAGKDISELSAIVMNQAKRGALASLGVAGGTAFLFGVLAGTLTAEMEYYNSEYFQNS